MNKFFNFLRENVVVLLMVLFGIAGVLTATFHFSNANGDNALWIIYEITYGVMALAFFGLTIVALALKKNRAANLLLGVFGGYLLFDGVRNVAVSLAGMSVNNNMEFVGFVLDLFKSLALLLAVVLILIPRYDNKKVYNFRESIKYILFLYLLLSIAVFVVRLIAYAQSNSPMGIVLEVVTSLVNPLILLTIYFHLFDRKNDFVFVKPGDAATETEMEAADVAEMEKLQD